MATQETLVEFQAAFGNLESLDKERLFRPTLGDESLQSTLEPKLTETLKKFRMALGYAHVVADAHVRPMIGLLQQLHEELNAQAERPSSEYIQYKESVLSALDSLNEAILENWPPFVTAALESRGFLEDEGIRKEYTNAANNLKEQADNTLASIKEESQKILAEARAVADEIETRARRTAANVSVEAAQKQFKEAQGHHEKQVKLWAKISGFSGGVFMLFGVLLWFVELDSSGPWQPLYYTALRLVLLTALGTFLAFCLRTLRAHSHMREQNLHRQRVANSIPSFVDSAVNPDQRDQILSQLIGAVATFGNSGLVSGRDDLAGPTKLAVDSVLRHITPPTS